MSDTGDRLSSKAYVIHNTRPIRWIGDQIQILDTQMPGPTVRAAVRIDGLTVNHEHAAKLHRAALSDGYAPGPPIAPKRDVMPAVIEWGIAILAALFITALIYAFWQMFQHLGHFYAN